MRLIALASCLVVAALARVEAAGRWDGLAARAGASTAELGIRPERFSTPLAIASVERALADPAAGFDAAAQWGRDLAESPGLAESLDLAHRLLFDAPAATRAAAELSVAMPSGLPRDLAGPYAALADAVGRAREDVRRAAAVYSPAEREKLLASFGRVAAYRPLAKVTAADVELARRFDVEAVVAAAARLAAEAQRQMPALRAAAVAAGPGSWGAGAVAIRGTGDDLYEAEALEGVELLIDLGGKNRYSGPAAAASAGQVRLVIDLGSDLVFESTQPAFGAGVFGIGLLVAPEPGAKSFTAGDFSLGAGFFGVGGVWAVGARSDAAGSHFTQGAAAFGAGVLGLDGAEASFKADYAAQGFGLTRGAGLFISRGSGARAACGLRHPDPREGLALISMCQGVGDGPRAYAAGGVGLAAFAGRGTRLESSYFAQGAGYWHAFGGLYIRGDGAFLQARRYSQGSGVHAGAGILSWHGSSGTSVNWGVGPGFGWDFGVGMLEVRGNANSLRADWAGARGDVNGRSLVEVAGDGNRLRLADWGASSLKRASPSYSLSRVTGAGNMLYSPGLAKARAGTFDVMTTPWGVTRADGEVSLEPEIAVATAAWPVVARDVDGQEQSSAMAEALARADAQPMPARAAAWLALASAFNLDGRNAMSAAAKLLELPREQAALVAAMITVEAFDEALWVRIVASAAGAPAAQAARKELGRASGLRRALLADLMRAGSARESVPAALSLLKERDWRLRRSGASLLGAVLGEEGGEEPGRLRFLEQAGALAVSTFAAESPEEAQAFKAIGYKRLTDLFAVLALDPALSARNRLDMLASGDPFDTVKAPTLRLFADILRGRAAAYGPALRRELERSRLLRASARQALREAVADPDPDARAGALAALGQVGALEDAERLGRGLEDPSSSAREAAALGLARLGEAARATLIALLRSSAPSVRALAVRAAAQSGEAAVVPLARDGFKDKDPRVRLAAVAALGAVQAPFYDAQRAEAASILAELAESDGDPSVAASASRVLGQIAPAAR